MIDDEASLAETTGVLLAEARTAADSKKTLTVPIAELATLGAGVSSLIPALHTVTTKDRFGIVRPRTCRDITLRFLTTGELAAAMSFPHDYVFCGGDTAAKKQIGNAVPPVLAEALYRAVLAA